MSTADACDREAAWLNTSGDGLPALHTNAGGPFDIVQAYIPRSPALRRKGLYVTRAGPAALASRRFSDMRRADSYDLQLKIWWPLSSGTGSAEADQRALDAAIAQVLQRVVGPVLDKTHGGRFMQVGEDPDLIHVLQPGLEVDALASVTSDAALRADVIYTATDVDYNA